MGKTNKPFKDYNRRWCKATNKDGSKCTQLPLNGQLYCRVHIWIAKKNGEYNYNLEETMSKREKREKKAETTLVKKNEFVQKNLYSKYSPPSLKKKLDEITNSPIMGNITQHIILMMAMNLELLDKYKKEKEFSTNDFDLLLKITDSIGKNIERYYKIEEKKNSLITIDNLNQFLGEIKRIIEANVEDKYTRTKIAQGLQTIDLQKFD